MEAVMPLPCGTIPLKGAFKPELVWVKVRATQASIVPAWFEHARLFFAGEVPHNRQLPDTYIFRESCPKKSGV
jgi:hypothetical protein